MARARNIKPGFFKNELLAEMPPETRLLFMGLWCLADREGRFEDRPKKIKMELFPCDSFSIEDSLAMLAKDGFLLRYEVDGKRYAQVVNFTKHQMPHHKEVPSEIPAPPGCAQVTRHAYDVPAKVREEVFARDGNACLKCGALESLSLDHIKPLGSGGDNSTNNLQTLCTSCNSSKGNTTKDYRKSNVEPTLSQRQTKQGAPCPSESGFSDSLIPDSLTPSDEGVAPRKRSTPAMTAARPDDVSEPVWQDFQRLRREKRAPLTDTALAGVRREAGKAGVSMETALAYCCEAGWQGFNAGWYADRQGAGGRGVAAQAVETYAQRAARQRMEEVAPMAARKQPGSAFDAAQRFMQGEVIDATPAYKQLQGA